MQLQIVVYDQKSKGKLSGKHKATVNAWVATLSHQKRRETNSLVSHRAIPNQYSRGKITPASQYNDERLLEYDNVAACRASGWRGRGQGYVMDDEEDQEVEIVRDLLPLGMFPCEVNAKEGKLIQYYMNVMSPEMCGLKKVKANYEPFCNGYFQMCLQHPVLFRITILGFTAGHGMLTRGAFKDDLDHQQYKSLREMQKYFKTHSSDCSDLSIAICLYRAMLDKCLTSGGAPLTHLGAALRMVQMRGGYKALLPNEGLLIILMTFRWRFARDRSDSANSPELQSSLALPEAGLRLENGSRYLQFLVRAESLAETQRNLGSDILPLRNIIFSQPGYIRDMLWPKDSGRHKFQWMDVDWMSLLIIVVTVNRALLDYQYDTQLTNLFLEDFQERVLQLQNDGHQFVRAIAKAIMHPSPHEVLNLKHWDRFWFATQMLEWVVQLGHVHESGIVGRLSWNLTGMID